jgi:hypothetical protein
MDTERYREHHEFLLRSNDLRINRLRRDFANECVAIVRRETAGKETYDAVTHMRVLRALEVPLNRLYGAYPGDPHSLLMRATVTSARLSYVLAFRKAGEIIRRHVSSGLIRQLQKEVDDGRLDRERERARF